MLKKNGDQKNNLLEKWKAIIDDDKDLELYWKITYSKGFIILSDYESTDNTGAFSRTTPLNHYNVFVYSSSTDRKDTYAHEIGHMLGLEHSFFNEKESNSYQKLRVQLIGDGLNKKGIIQHINTVSNNNNFSYGWTGLTAIRDHIIDKLNSYTTYCKNKIAAETTEMNKKKAYYIHYKDSDKVGLTQTKKQYFDVWKGNIKQYQDHVEENNKALTELKKNPINNIVNANYLIRFKRVDLLTLLKEDKSYSEKVLSQIQNCLLFFQEKSTKNIMDYSNAIYYFNFFQIKIMRDDFNHYIDIKKNTTSSKK